MPRKPKIKQCSRCGGGPVAPGRGRRLCDHCKQQCPCGQPRAPNNPTYCLACIAQRNKNYTRVNTAEQRQRDNLRKQINRQVQRGELAREPCGVCGATDKVWVYLPELLNAAVVWLCPKHHYQMQATAGVRYSGYVLSGRKPGKQPEPAHLPCGSRVDPGGLPVPD